MRTSTVVKALAISLSVSCLQAFSALAGTITFYDLTDTVTVTLSQDLIDRGSSWSSSGETATVILLPPYSNFGSVSWANTTIYEPDPPGQIIVSDTITVNPIVNPSFHFEITFTSDTEGAPPLQDVGNPMTEDGTIQESRSYARWDNGAVVDQVFFQSDVSDVPEPSTILLLVSGLSMLAIRRRSRA